MKWIQRNVDHVVVILPFEAELYRRAGVRCTFVGHPLLDSVAPRYDRSALRAKYNLDPSTTVIGLLPGSRVAEVTMLLPLLLETARRLAASDPKTQFVLAQASTIAEDLLQGFLGSSPVSVHVAKDQASEVMAVSDLLLVASGTATLQAAVVGTPMILLYKTTLPTYWLARMWIRVKWIGLVNLVAGRSIVPELIQDEATVDRLLQEARRLLTDAGAYNDMKEGLRQVRALLGEPGASGRAADVVLEECRA
jgi:lipid-A-disaccharide synthase